MIPQMLLFPTLIFLLPTCLLFHKISPPGRHFIPPCGTLFMFSASFLLIKYGPDIPLYVTAYKMLNFSISRSVGHGVVL